MSAHETDNQPRYTTKRLHDEIDHARRLGRLEALQEAAAIVDDSAGEFEKAAGGSDGVAHDAMLLAGDALELVRDAIRERISAVPASAPREEIFPKYRNLVNGDLCELVSQGVDGVAFRRVGSTQLAYLGHPEFSKRFEEVPQAPLPNVVGSDPVAEIVEATSPAAELIFGRDIKFFEALRTLPIGTKLYAAPLSVGGDRHQRILGILDDFAEMQPEEDEDWESWYHAAFDLARQKIRAALASTEGTEG